MDVLTTATSADEAARKARVAVLPVGSFEQHGEHLPLTTDTVIACLIAQRIAEDYDLFLLPPITVSCSHEHDSFPGTVSVSATTLVAMIEDIRVSLRRSDITKLVLVNGHGGNYVLSNITQQANTDERCVVLFPGGGDMNRAREHAGAVTSSHEDMHAGELETSLLLHAHPHLVGESYYRADHQADDRPHLLTLGVEHYSPSGVIGRPSEATAAKGRAILDSLSTSFFEHLTLIDPR
ncbi:creatininase family protein [Saccharopolyspora sp. HNM0986]|uniref:creatininase family protein n=1 Tax=Saccharopolyspora galaxeae TaxID=2781241 RepID=UPI00190E52F0|nr:creatininase family protein [Saccharopolyspora sp. HNM0986]MBK0870416.1 creatininase family protein [Saccharopolyspora sp. HNM0986]